MSDSVHIDQKFRINRTVKLLTHSHHVFETRAREISLVEVSIISPKPMKLDVVLEADFSLPIPGKGFFDVRAKCKVIYNTLIPADATYHVGLQFLEMDAQSSSIVKEYVDYRIAVSE